MEVIYSIGVRFGGGGIGNIALNAVRGICRHGFLKRLLVATDESKEIDGKLVKKILFPKLINKAMYLANFGDVTRSMVTDRLFDRMAVRHIEKCDIFHGWNNFSLLSLRKAKSLGALTVIERASSHPATQNALLDEEYERFLNKRYMNESVKRVTERSLEELSECDYITVPSEFAAESMVHGGVDRKKLLLIPFGVNVDKYRPVVKADKTFRVLFMGQVSIRKGIPYLLAAWDGLKLKDAELAIVGAAFPDTKGILEKYSGNPTVKFYGHIRDPIKMFQSSSIFVFPSIEEGSALVNYEAMACGLPVVTTGNSGSVVRDGVDGYVIPVRDTAAIREKIETLYADKGKRETMGASARARIEKYTWHNYGENLVREYRRVSGL